MSDFVESDRGEIVAQLRAAVRISDEGLAVLKGRRELDDPCPDRRCWWNRDHGSTHSYQGLPEMTLQRIVR